MAEHTATYWEQISQISLCDAALFLTGSDDPREHESLMKNDMAYDHFTATMSETYGENLSIVLDALESGQLSLTTELKTERGQRDLNSKISKESFVKWCESKGHFRIARLLGGSVADAVLRKGASAAENFQRRQTALRRHNELKTSGAKNPTQQLAAEMGVTPARIRQLLQQAKKDLAASSATTLIGQLQSTQRSAK